MTSEAVSIWESSLKSFCLIEDTSLSWRTSAFLLGVSRLSAPKLSDPGESLWREILDSSFFCVFHGDGVFEAELCLWSREGGVAAALCNHLNETFSLSLSISELQHTQDNGRELFSHEDMTSITCSSSYDCINTLSVSPSFVLFCLFCASGCYSCFVDRIPQTQQIPNIYYVVKLCS